ncbi:hypothetical protein KC19_7G132800 [Ceratodon purpureus]|uniref:Ribosome maturation factor RimP N-terminal domain-containing protein n=1 Tax=Ceratodon purpureus TaxID=3225 RepID=A0A8T0H835_CERPU|nr:hypothetical protein KC19_7G132800 [Ceratodon purpureus]
MRTLRLLSFGPGSPCWTAQVAPLYIASQRAYTPASAAHEFAAGIRVREGEARVQQVRVWHGASSLRGFGEPSSTSYGGFGVSGASVSAHGRMYTKVAGKKGKKGEKDVLVKEREEEGVEGEEDVEKVEGKKVKKKKSKEVLANGDAFGVVDDNVSGLVGEGDQEVESKEKELKELLSELKEKKKSKNKLKHESEAQLETEESDPGVMQNGAVNGGIQEANLHTEGKGKKKHKNKVKRGDSEVGQSEESNPIVESHKKQKEKKKSKDKEKSGDIAVSRVVLEDTEESDVFENVDESASVIEDGLAEELEGFLDDDDFWEDDFEPEAELNDGGDGGGVVLGDAPWAKTALQLAEEVVAEFNGALEIFAFKASKDTGIIRVRVDKLADKYGSPSMDELQKYSSSYSKLLDKAGEAKTIPDDLALEVSSPGAERVVRIPQDLERFKDLPMYVRYVETSSDSSAETPEKDGILELESVDTEVGSAKWKLADVRLNRELAGKGRGLNRKQRDWRVDLPFGSINLVRLYIDV